MLFLWLKALHLFAVIAWFAGLFYLPRLFVYHAQTEDELGRARFCVMERRLFTAIMQPAAVVTLITGLGLWLGYYADAGWVLGKLLLVTGLLVFHFWCARQRRAFAAGQCLYSARAYRWFNEAPSVLLIGILWLVVFKPF